MINIIFDSYHVIYIIEKYKNNKRKNYDIIATFDFTSFYTEIDYEFIINKITKLYIILNDKNLNNIDDNNDYIEFYKNLCKLLIDGYNLSRNNAFINIDNILNMQKQVVIMGDSSAPMVSNLIILIHLIECKIYLNVNIVLCIRMMYDT